MIIEQMDIHADWEEENKYMNFLFAIKRENCNTILLATTLQCCPVLPFLNKFYLVCVFYMSDYRFSIQLFSR